MKSKAKSTCGLCWFWIGESEIYIHTSESSGDFMKKNIQVLFKRKVF